MKEFTAVTAVVIIFSVCVLIICGKIKSDIISTFSYVNSSDSDIVILDAGHGGEDGGCVAFDDTLEKDLNLLMSSNIALYFEIFGIDYITIRDSDISVGDTTLPTIRQRKVSDIKNRFNTVNSYENSVLLSIHQNMYSVEKYSGTQVFYSENIPESEALASSIQLSVVNNLQPENTRKIKSATDSIYLLYNAERPSVMVECGFLSNIEELNLLKTEEYRSQLAYFIFRGISNYYKIKE